MANAKLTSKGQTTIPKEIRDALGLKTGDQLQFTRLANGLVIMRACNKPVARLKGITGYQGPVIPTEAMRPDV
ncbi:MAG: type II toxin-antitoxin system PrlF family antitoxin [Casimicrobiaceae bacterium]|nr:type II toxin-antitoxin system PrlF family antitoxin [Casimicrobiaceae bacterium]MCX8098376.1 type II toxin-antitoxin system PrlF family antitoxin [Casimicrobiaceae bacterium]MDW8312560.1 type II toxin-antitoxin system PrlF family antitoxin [Burkholderiales bacterium]